MAVIPSTINYQYVQATPAQTATKANLSALIRDVLISCNWTSSVSGDDTTLVSPGVAQGGALVQGLSMSLVLNPVAATNCLRLRVAEANGVNLSDNFFLLPNLEYTIVASRNWLYIWERGTSRPRSVFYCGVPAVKAVVVPMQAAFTPRTVIYAGGNANSDTDTSPRESLRTHLNFGSRSIASANTCPAFYANYNGTVLSVQGTVPILGMGCPQIVHLIPSAEGTQSRMDLTGDMSGNVTYCTEPLLKMSVTGTTDINTRAPIVGQLFDAFISARAYVEGTVFTVRGVNYIPVTNGNYGLDGTNSFGTLFIRAESTNPL
jgi:hypothetical protein